MVTLASKPAPTLRLRILALVTLSALLAALLVGGPARPAAAQAAPASDGWTLATTSPAAAAGAPAYIGNGYAGTRVPADGAGYAAAPTLTVRLAGTPTLGQATLTWLEARPLAPYQVLVRTGGAWRTVATVRATADLVDKVGFAPVAGDAVRLQIPATRFGGQNPQLAELVVSG